MRNKTFFILFLLLFVFSCSKDNPLDTDDDDVPTLKLGIEVLQKEANIFDNVRFTIYPDYQYSPLLLEESYDSIVWFVQELDNRLKVLKHDQNSSHYRTFWEQSFYNEGEYHTILHGYKNEKIILADTVVVQIQNKRDILGYNWNEIKENQPYIMGSANVLDAYYCMVCTSTDYENGSPALGIYFRLVYAGAYSAQKEKEFYEQKQEKIAYDYISGLYGQPQLSYSADSIAIVNAYKNTFKKGDKTLQPRYIWQTAKNKIVLLEKYKGRGDYNYYFALAEPNE